MNLATLILTNPARRETLTMIVGVVVQPQTKLFHVVRAGGAAGRLSSLLDSW